MGHLILGGASHLDAFSACPFRTWLPGYASGETTDRHVLVKLSGAFSGYIVPILLAILIKILRYMLLIFSAGYFFSNNKRHPLFSYKGKQSRKRFRQS